MSQVGLIARVIQSAALPILGVALATVIGGR
jgi:hypothetical protein